MNAAYLNVQSYFSFEDVSIRSTWRSTKETARTALKVVSACGLFWSNPTVFAFGAAFGFVKGEAFKETLNDIADVWQYHKLKVLSLLSVGAFLSIHAVFGAATLAFSGGFGSQIYLTMQKVRAKVGDLSGVKLFPKLTQYLSSKAPDHSWTNPMKNASRGLTLLYGYYCFLDNVEEFYNRIKELTSSELNLFEFSKNKKYSEKDTVENNLEHFSNDILFLQEPHESTVDQLKMASDKISEKNLSSEFQITSLFKFNEMTNSYFELEQILHTVANADTAAKKFVMLCNGNHSVGLFVRKNKCYIYDTKEQKQLDSMTITEACQKIQESFSNNNEPITLGIEVIANKELEELKQEKQRLYSYINVGEEGDVFSPLHLAAQNGHNEAIDALITAHADDARTYHHATPLHIASQFGHEHVVDTFIRRNQSSVNLVYEDGLTPLHLAAKAGHLNVCKVLVGKGANKDQQDNKHKKAEDYARDNGFPETAEAIRRANVDEVSRADSPQEITSRWIPQIKPMFDL